jgi:sigma-E factor negative regulatory protein RseC
MTEQNADVGIVTAVAPNRITVEIEKGGGCKSCGMKNLCGVSSNNLVLQFDTSDSYSIGDRVIVSVSAGIRVLSALLVFGFPLAVLFIAFILARLLFNELVSVAAAFIGFVLSFLVIKLIDKRIVKHIEFKLEGKCENLSE